MKNFQKVAVETQSFVSSPNYDSGQIREVIENLEFLTHRPSSEARRIIDAEPAAREKRLKKIDSLVQIVNDNIQNETRITAELMINNPKLLSFKLMKMDLEQSCRAKCEIEKGETMKTQLSQKVNVIANSSDQLHVQALQKAKVPSLKPEQEPKGYNPAVHNNNVDA